ncbi:MAG: YgeY family selenium metabolism-linked hydrolase [Acidobacteria bacterium]|nr:YgeY family selenium metabolism-linked hydrolase [Acidobacteriota bacterium]
MELQIRELAQKYADFTAQTLAGLVRIPSFSGEEAAVCHHIATLLTGMGLPEVRPDGFGNIIARVGNGARVLAFDAHVDTVKTGDPGQWARPPFSGEIVGGRLYGRGAADQKGGAAAMITAARILHELDYRGDFSVYFTFTVLEEDCEGLCWTHLLTEERLRPDFVVFTEPTSLHVTRGQRGRMEMDVTFRGVSAHGSAPERGDNAVSKAARAVLALEDLHRRLPAHPFLGKGSLVVTEFSSSAPSLCAVPDGARLHIDRRLTWGETRDSALAEIAACVGPADAVTVPVTEWRTCTGLLRRQEQYFPAWMIEDHHPLVRAAVKTAQAVTGSMPVVDKWVFSTNGVVTCGTHGIPAIGYGPGHEVQAHAPDEWTPLDHLVPAAAFYASLPLNL